MTPHEAPLGDISGTSLSKGQVYAWADLVELNCLAHPDGVMTFESIAELANADAGHALEVLGLFGNRSDADDAMREEQYRATDADRDLDTEDDGLDHTSPTTAEVRRRRRRTSRIRSNFRDVRPVDQASPGDRRHVLAADIVRLLQWRHETFGSDYPFELTEHVEGPSLHRGARLSERQILYTFLLVASSLSTLREKADEALFTYPFERLTGLVLQTLFPNADVHLFGTSDRDPDTSNLLTSKVATLGKLVKGEVGRDVHLTSTSNVGDGGLDAYAHIGFGDAQEGRFVVFAQAACTDEWVTKQTSASPTAWRHVLSLQVPQVSVCAIPISFRRTGGDWFDLTKLRDALVIDRSRLMTVVQDGFDGLEPSIEPEGLTRSFIESIASAS